MPIVVMVAVVAAPKGSTGANRRFAYALATRRLPKGSFNASRQFHGRMHG